MKTNGLLLMGICVFFSYCSSPKSIRNILTVDCYWDILRIAEPHPINSCYKFNSGGDCNFYYYNFYNKQRTDSVFLYDDDDVVVPNKWNIKGDSILSIRNIDYFILNYNSDSVYLHIKNRDTVILVKNCKTYNPRDKLLK
jgi:hypothetical protein